MEGRQSNAWHGTLRLLLLGQSKEAEHRAQEVYGEKYSPLLMFDSKRAVSRMLHEDMERQAVRRMVRQTQKEQHLNKRKDKGPER